MDTSSKCVNASGLADGIRDDNTPPPFGWRLQVLLTAPKVLAVTEVVKETSRPRHGPVSPSGDIIGGGENAGRVGTPQGASTLRSEEHTSELQSRRDLVCRLLLEKKKKTHKQKT